MRVETKIARRVFALFLGFFALALSSTVQAAPRDGRVVQGSGSITQSGTHTDIHQNSDFLATRWGNFNIAAHESVQAHQPSSTARLLIRVDGGGATNIAGSYTSNGITILENQNGVQFSRGAIVNVGGLLATSSRISGVGGNHWQLNGVGGAVVNHGQIVAGAGGAILAAVKVQNTGDITAKGGDVALGAGSSFTVDFAGSMVGFEVEQAASGASIANTGKIESQGGVVALSAQEAQAVRTNVVSVGGVVKATKIERRGGVVYLSGGDEGIAEVSGDIQADEKVQTTGKYVVVKEGAVLRAPELLVGGDFQGRDGVQTAKRTLVEAGALLDAGAKGRVIVWSDETTWFNGDITAPEGFAEVSGKKALVSVNMAGIDVGEFGVLLLDPPDIIIAATGDPLPAGNNIVANAPPSTTLTLGVGDINSFGGDLSLAASDTIMVSVAILKPTGGLTLTAGGVLTLGANITTSAGALVLSGSGIMLSGDTTLTGAAITIITADTMNIGTRALTITANGQTNGHLTLNTDITGTGSGAVNLTSMHGDLTLGAGVQFSLDARPLVLTAGGDFIFEDTEGTPPSSITASSIELSGPMLPAAPPPDTVITFSIVPTGRTESGPVPFWFENGVDPTEVTDCAEQPDICSIQRTDQSLEITVATLTANTSLTINIGDGTLTFAGSDMIMITSPSVTISAGMIDLENRNLIITANGNALALNLGADITNGGFVTIGAVNKALTFNITTARTLTAGTISFLSSGLITAGQALSLHARDLLVLSSSLAGSGNLTLGTGTATEIRLVAVGNAPSVEISANGTLTLNGTTLTNLAMDGSVSPFNGLTLSATGASGRIELNGDINILPVGGVGQLLTISSSGTLVLSGTRTITNVGAITLTGALTSTNTGLTLTSGGDITLNGDIGLGEGALVLTAGEGSGTGDIMNGGNAPTLTAGSISLMHDGVFGADLLVIVSTDLTLTTAAAQTVHGWMVGTNRALSLTATGDIMIDEDVAAGDGDLTFDGAAIVLGAGVTLTGGAVSLKGAIAGPNGLMIDASGDITLNSDIATGGAALTLDSATRINLGAGITLMGGAIMLTGAINPSNAVTITATGDLTLNSDINSGAGALVLGGANIFLRGSGGTRTLMGGSVELNGNLNSRVEGGGAAGSNIVITAANGNITITGTITTTGNNGANDHEDGGDGGDVTLTATTGGITISSDINLDGGVGGRLLRDNIITFNETGGNGGVLTLTANSGNIMVGGNINLNGARGRGNFDSNVDGGLGGNGGSVTFTATGGNITINGSMNANGGRGGDGRISSTSGDGGKGGVIILQGANVMVGLFNARRGAAGPISDQRFDSFGSDGAAGEVMITATGGDLTLRGNIDVDEITLIAQGGTGAILNDGTSRSLTADTVSLTQDVVFAGGDLFTFPRPDSIVTLATSAAQIVQPWMVSNGFSLVLTTGTMPITLAQDDATNRDITLTGSAIILMGDITLGGRNITLSGAIDDDEDDDLTLTASGNLTLMSDIDVGTSILTLTAGHQDGTGSLTPNDTITLTAATLSLTQDDLFGSSAPYTLAVTSQLNLTTANVAAQALQQVWMLATGRNLALNAAGQITIGVDVNTGDGNLSLSGMSVSITGGGQLMGNRVMINGNVSSSVALTITATANEAGALTFGANTMEVLVTGEDLTLTANGGAMASIVFSAGSFTLGGATIGLTGMIDESANDRNLTLTSAGIITLNSGINLGMGRLSITAFMLSTPRNIGITASPIDIEFTDEGITIPSAGYVDGEIRATFSETVAYVLDVEGCDTPTRCEIGDSMTAIDNLSPDLDASQSILINVGTSALGFGGEGAITINAPMITIIAGTINIGARTLTITASGGTLTLTLNGALNGSGNVELSAAGNLVIAGNISLGAGELTLTAGDGMTVGDIGNGDVVRTLTAMTVSFTQDSAFSSEELFTFPGVGTLNLTTRAGPQVLYSWMAASGRLLNLTAASQIRINGNNTDDEDFATAGDLTLNAATIYFVGRNTTLRGGNITINGRVEGDVAGDSNNPHNNTAITTDGDLTINGDIDFAGEHPRGQPPLGGNNLTFTARAGDITITGSINTEGGCCGTVQITADNVSNPGGRGGNIVIDASGAVDITDTIRASGGAGVQQTSGGRAGRGGDGGDITIMGTTIIFDALESVGGQPGPVIFEIPQASNVGGNGGMVEITSAGALTAGGNIDLSGETAGTITFIAGTGGSGAIGNDGASRTLTARMVSLTQADAFGSDALFTFTTPALSLSTAATQPIELWMTTTGRSLTLTATGSGQITIGRDINIGTGDLTLAGTTTSLIGSHTLTARNITLNAVMSAANQSLTLVATQAVTFGGAINLGGGSLTLTAGAPEPLRGTALITANAATFNLSDPDIVDENTIPALRDRDITFATSTPPVYNIAALGCPQNDVCIIPRTGDIVVRANLSATTSISITATGGVITFSGDGNITLNAPTISIIAASINLAGRTLIITNSVNSNALAITINANINNATQITATGGTLSFGGVRTISGAAINISAGLLQTASNANLSIIATNGLTIATDINIGTGMLALTAGVGGSTGDISNGSTTRTLTAGSVSLTQDGTVAFADNLFTIASATSLTLMTGTAQTVHGWMIGGTNRTLSLTAGGDITIGGIVNVGNGNITLVATGSNITLSGPTTLTGGVITLNGAISGTNALTIDASGNITLNDNIATGTGNLTLDSETNIVLVGTIILTGATVALTGAINESGSDALTITATGQLTLNSNINIGTGVLNLTAGTSGTGNIDNGTGTPELTARVVNLTQVGEFALTEPFTFGSSVDAVSFFITNDRQRIQGWMVVMDRSLSVRSVGRPLAILNNIEIGRGDLILSSPNGINFNSATTLSGGAVTLDGPILGGTIDLTVRATGQLTLNSNISVRNLTLTAGTSGTGDIASGAGTQTLTAGTVSLTQASIFGSVAPFTFAASVGTLNLTVTAASGNQTVEGWMFAMNNRSLSLTSSGQLLISGAVNNGVINIGSGTLTLDGSPRIVLDEGGGDITLMAGAVVLNNPVDGTVGGNNFTVMATGQLTLNGSVNLGSMSALTLTAGTSGTGDIVGAGMSTLTAGTVSLRQAGVFDETALFTFNLATSLTLTTGTAQTVHDWMIVTNRALILTAGGDITIGRDINVGNGDLTLVATGSNIVLGADIELTGAAVTLTGAIDSSDDNRALIISASGDITLNSNINTGTGDLTLTATGANIVLGGNALFFDGGEVALTGTIDASDDGYALTIRAMTDLRLNSNIILGAGELFLAAGRGEGQTGTIILQSSTVLGASLFTLIQNGALFPAIRPAAFEDADGDSIPTQGNPRSIVINYDGGMRQGNVAWARAIILSTVTFDQVDDMGNVVIPAGDNIIDGVISAIELITIDAGSGTVTFAEGVPADITFEAPNIMITAEMINVGTRSLTLRAATGTITLNVGSIIGTGAASLSLISPRIDGLSESLTLNVPSVTVEQNAAFSSTAPFTFGATVVSLTIETTAAQEYYSWMRGDVGNDNFDLSLTSTGGAVIVNENINIGTGNLTLSGASIVLGGAGNRRLIGRVIMLTGAIDTSSTNNVGLFARASGALMINSDINLGTGALTLTAGFGDGTGDIIASSTPTLTANTVSLTQDGARAFGATDWTIASNTLTLTTAAAQTVHGWMTASGRNLSLTSTGGAVIVNENINIAAGNLTLDGMGGITLGGSGVRQLIGGVITLTGAIDTSSTNNVGLLARASGALTINNDINTGNGDLTLQGASIVLGGSGNRRLIGGAVMLTGAIDASGGGHGLTITATGDITLNSNINIGTGNLTLDGVTITLGGTGRRRLIGGAITLTGAIDTSSTNVGLLARATSGALTLNSDINTGTGALTLEGATIVLDGVITGTGAGTPSMSQQTAADFLSHVSLTSTSGAITISQNITTTGDITINSFGQINFITNAIALTGSNIRLTGEATSALGLTFKAVENFSEVQLTDDNFNFGVNPPGFLGATITRDNGDVVINDALTITSGNLSVEADGDITINNLTASDGTITLTAGFRSNTIRVGVGAQYSTSSGEEFSIIGFARRIDISKTGNIMAVGGGTPTLDASTVTLTQDGAFAADLLTVASATSLNLTTGADQIVHNVWMVVDDRNLSVISTGGAVIVNENINIAAGNLTLSGATITLGGSGVRRLIGSDITLTGAIDTSSTNNVGLFARASGALTINNDINTGTGALTLTAGFGDGTGDIIASSTPTLTASTVSLTQDGTRAFGTTDWMIVSNTLTLTTAADQIVHNAWMVSTNRTLSLTSTGGAVIVNDNINIGTGNLTLSGATIVLGGAGNRRLIGGVIMLTGAIDTSSTNNVGLFARASGALTINSDINLGTGTLTLMASLDDGTGDIIASGTPTLTASTVSLTQDGTRAFGATDWAIVSNTLTLTTAAAQTVHGWMTASGRNLSLTSTGVITITEDAINLGTGNLTLSGASLAAINMAGLTITAGAVELTGVLNTSNAAVDGAPVTITASGALTINNNIVTNLAALTLGGASIVFNRNVRLAGGTINFNGEIDGTACGGCTLRAIGRAGNITFNNNVDFGTGVIVLNAAGGNIASGSTPPIIRSRNLVVRQDGAFSINLFGEASLITNAVRLFINDAATTQTIHPWLATLSGSVFALGGFDMPLASITTTTAITNSNRIELRAATITLGGVLTSANVSLRTNMIAGMVDIRATTGNIAATDIIDGGAAGTGVPTLAPTVTSLALRQNGAFGAAAPFTFGAEVTTLTLETTAAQTYAAWMRADDRNLSLTSTGGAVIVNDNINVGTGDLTLSGTTITLGGSGVRRLIGGAITLTGAIDTSSTNNVGLLARATAGDLTLNSDINLGTGNLTLDGTNILLNENGDAITLSGGAVTLTGAVDGDQATNDNDFTITATGDIALNSDINLGAGALDLTAGMGDTTGDISSGGGTRTLTAGTVSLTQDGTNAFGPTDWTIVSNTLTLTTAAAQTVHDWMTASGRNLSLTSTGVITINEDAINLGTGNLTLSGASLAATNTAGLTITAGAVELTGTLNTSNAAVGGAPVTITANGTLTLNNNIVTNLAALTLGGASIVFNRNVRLAGGTIVFNGEIDGTTCGGCTLRAIGRAGDITFNENVDFGTGVIILLATGGNIASGSTPPIIRSRNLIIRQEGAFSADLFSEASLITNAVRLFINDAATTQTIHPWLATLSGSVFALGGFNATLTSITTTTAFTNSNRIELRAALITLGGVLTSANVSLRTNMIAGTVDIRATTGNIAATNIIAVGAAGTGVPTLATTVTSLALRQNGAFGAAAPFTFGAEVTTLTLETTAAQPYAAWMRADDRNLSLTSTGGAVIVNENINIGTGNLTLNGMGGITLGGSGTRRLIGGAITLTGAISSGTNVGLLARASAALTLNDNINVGTGNLTLEGATITLGGTGRRRLIGGAITLTGAIDTSSTNNVGLLARASGALTINDNINVGTGALTLESTASPIVFGSGVSELRAGSFTFAPTTDCTSSTTNPRCTDTTP